MGGVSAKPALWLKALSKMFEHSVLLVMAAAIFSGAELAVSWIFRIQHDLAASDDVSELVPAETAVGVAVAAVRVAWILLFVVVLIYDLWEVSQGVRDA